MLVRLPDSACMHFALSVPDKDCRHAHPSTSGPGPGPATSSESAWPGSGPEAASRLTKLKATLEDVSQVAALQRMVVTPLAPHLEPAAVLNFVEVWKDRVIQLPAHEGSFLQIGQLPIEMELAEFQTSSLFAIIKSMVWPGEVNVTADFIYPAFMGH